MNAKISVFVVCVCAPLSCNVDLLTDFHMRGKTALNGLIIAKQKVFLLELISFLPFLTNGTYHYTYIYI